MSENLLVQNVWLIPPMPLAGVIVTATCGPWLLKRNSHWPAVIGAVLATVLSFVVLIVTVQAAGSGPLESPEHGHGAHGTVATTVAYSWIRAGDFHVPVTLRVDALTSLMLVMVTFVGALIFIYSISYMRGDPGYWRFFTYMSLFLFSMTMLVLSSNFVLLYVFWEAVGLCSYLLIGFWYRRPSAAAAAKKAFLVNRIGDFGFALGILLLWLQLRGLEPAAGTAVLDYENAFAKVAQLPSGVLLAVCLLLFCGAVGKSAQFPLHVWLPDAMEGPTPVSALIHAATMVTAGVYMVGRLAPLYLACVPGQAVVAAIGAFTALLAALIALTQTDLKRILAYSTISQLGYMFLALGCGSLLGLVAAIFHVFTHAFFKALLFLGAGSVMHAMGDVIDIARFSGLRHRLPITCWTFIAGAAALAGLPPLAGFWSKDEILVATAQRAAGGSYTALFFLLLAAAVLTTLLTAFYTFRAVFKTFWGPEVLPEEAAEHGHAEESPPVMYVPLIVLATFAVLIGLLVGPTGLIERFLEQTPGWAAAAADGGHHYGVLVTSVVFALGGLALAWLMYGEPSELPGRIAERFRWAYELSRNKFWFDELYEAGVVRPTLATAASCRWADNWLVDGLVRVIAGTPAFLARLLLRPLQNGLLQFYALSMLLGLLLLLIFVWLV